MGHPYRILFVQTWGLGDCIMTLPAMAGLKAMMPDAHIHALVGNPVARELLTLTGLLESCTLAPTRPANLAFFRTLWRLRSSPFDEVFVATEIHALMGGMLRACGVSSSIRGNPRGFLRHLYNQPVQFDAEEHRVLANLRIVRSALPNAELGSTQLRLPLLSPDLIRPAPYVVIQPGSAEKQSFKRPSLTCIEVIIESLVKEFPDLLIYILLGPEEADLLPYFEKCTDRWKHVSLLSKLTLWQVGRVLQSALALIAADSGIGHLAALVSCPVITLASPEAPARTFPWGKGNRALRESWNCPHPNPSEIIKTFAQLRQGRGS